MKVLLTIFASLALAGVAQGDNAYNWPDGVMLQGGMGEYFCGHTGACPAGLGTACNGADCVCLAKVPDSDPTGMQLQGAINVANCANAQCTDGNCNGACCFLSSAPLPPPPCTDTDAGEPGSCDACARDPETGAFQHACCDGCSFDSC